MATELAIIVVEDHDIAAIVVDYLRHAGYAVEHQAEGRAALASMLTTPPDLTLLDIMLPGIDGLAILRQARRQTIPILMLTARGDEPDGLTWGRASRLKTCKARHSSPRWASGWWFSRLQTGLCWTAGACGCWRLAARWLS